MPATPLAGEHDARAVSINAGGLALLRGPDLTLALDLEDHDVSNSGAPGFGAFFGTSGGGGLLPRFGFGLGFEWLRPARTQLVPDPGEPFRFTMGFALGLGPRAGLGFAWHHFSAEGALDGKNSWDLGLSTRWGSYIAIGAALRDINTGVIGDAPVQRRYELELVARPLGTDTLDVAVGGRVGERRLDVDGWARISARVARGVYAIGAVESRQLYALEDSPTGRREIEGRDLRATLGLEVSFGGFGVTALGTGLRDERGTNHALGATLVMRLSSPGPASVLGRPDHIERVELAGEVDTRELTALVVKLRAIANDRSAVGLVVMFDGLQAGWGALQELRNEIARVRKAGKKTFAYMVSGTARDYYVATAADRIYVDPAGGLRIVGLAGTSFYLRGALDLVGVNAQYEKIGEYKSFPESFTETHPTEPAARMTNEMYDSLWDEWVSAVAEGRKLTKDEVKALVDKGPFTAGDLAKDKKLVDFVGSPEKVTQMVMAEVGGVYPVSGAPRERPERWTRPGVAIIYVDGDIIDGKSRKLPLPIPIPLLSGDLVGGETLIDAITAARNDPRVGAIILRIDSPGGSAVASELVSREVFATRGVKPIICSFSDVAASGGYFIAAGCDTIFAEPMTITGSIGIFYGKFDLSGLLKKLGVTVSTYKRGKRADVESLFRPLTDEERAALMDQLRYVYNRFVGAVAEGRKLGKDRVDALGRGHVYTGAMAQPLKLVDRFGGIADAMDEAKRRMGISADTRLQIFELPVPPTSLVSWVFKQIGLSSTTQVNAADVPVLGDMLRAIPGSLLAAPKSVQARMPYDIRFE